MYQKQPKHIFIFEYILALSFPIQLYIPLFFSQLIFIFLTLLKIKFESTRFTIFPIIVTNIFMTLYICQGTLIFLIFYIIAQIFTILLLFLMPIYKYPNPTGQYEVGFKQINNIFIYYPVDYDTRQQIPQIRGVDYIWRIYNAYQHILKNKVPLFIIRIMLQYIHKIKLEIIEDKQITSKLDKFNVIIFSNGLNGLINHYSILLKDWASQGYIVFGVQQDEPYSILTEEEVNLIRKKIATLENQEGIKIFNKIKYIRNQQLEKRVIEMLDIINNISHIDQKLLIKGLNSHSIDWNKIIIAGHSFGGASAFQLASCDKRICAILLFDPWFFPLRDEIIQNTKLDIGILCVNSERFRLRKESRVIELNNKIFNNQKKCLVLMIKGSDHLAITDLPYFLSFELKLIKKLVRKDDILELTMANLEISKTFLKEIIIGKANISHCLEKYSYQCDQLFILKRNLFKVEYIYDN